MTNVGLHVRSCLRSINFPFSYCDLTVGYISPIGPLVCSQGVRALVA
jgi:hypothetical protein